MIWGISCIFILAKVPCLQCTLSIEQIVFSITTFQPEEPPPATARPHLEAAPAAEPLQLSKELLAAPAAEPLHPGNTEELFVASNGKASCLAPKLIYSNYFILF